MASKRLTSDCAATVESRVLIAVIAEREDDRVALSTVFAAHPAHRVICSSSMGLAGPIIDRQRIDAIVGLVRNRSERERFRFLAAGSRALSMLLDADPNSREPVGGALTLNAVIRLPVEALVSRAAALVEGLAVERTPVPAANAADRRLLESLSDREQEILTLTAQGMSIKAIAAQLHRGYGTVATHRVRIMKKLGLNDKVALARFAIRTGLIEA